MNMFYRAIAGACMVMAAVSAGFSEELTVESNTFTFPEMTAVRVRNITPQENFFRYSSPRQMSRSITFSWAFPGSLSAKTGTITIYSLLGRVVAKLPVQKNTGNATWQFSQGLSRNGLFIARISYGENTRNLKLMLWN
jgi:hypothetical protein